MLKISDFPTLKDLKGRTLITTDGTTLLGADDKAGVAEIVTALEEIISSGMPHGDIWVGFTPDEEIGAGPNKFDVKGFGCDFAYTLDGGNRRITFTVTDTGPGIPASEAEHIFGRFVKLDTFTQGTGLGLSICKSIAEQLGGSVGVDSVAGEGSCFRIDIPAGE